MDHPVIGVTTYYGKNQKGLPIVALLKAYVDAVVHQGGIPVLIPSSLPGEGHQTLLDKLDGVLFTGGGDISIDKYKGLPHPRIHGVDEDRDTLELSMLNFCLKSEKAFLGICRGIQLIAIGTGGTLFSHIEEQMTGALQHDYSKNFPRTFLAHKIRVEKGTQLAEILGETEIEVNSLHHQGVRSIGAKLKTAAYASDGLIEAIEIPGHPFGVAVQWHPEWLTDQESSRRLFKAFISAAGRQK